MVRQAGFSPCRRYRYWLRRSWGRGRYLLVVGLNPSTADETVDDATIRRLIAYAKRWGYAGLLMTNLFAFRATDPEAMKECPEPEGEANLDTIRALLGSGAVAAVLCAWGAHGSHRDQDVRVGAVLEAHRRGRRLMCLGRTTSGQPKHPLRLRGDLEPEVFQVRGAG